MEKIEPTNKLLVTFNTCGISGKENVGHYIDVIHQLLSQEFTDYHVVLSSCMNNDYTFSPRLHIMIYYEWQKNILLIPRCTL